MRERFEYQNTENYPYTNYINNCPITKQKCIVKVYL